MGEAEIRRTFERVIKLAGFFLFFLTFWVSLRAKIWGLDFGLVSLNHYRGGCVVVGVRVMLFRLTSNAPIRVQLKSALPAFIVFLSLLWAVGWSLVPVGLIWIKGGCCSKFLNLYLLLVVFVGLTTRFRPTNWFGLVKPIILLILLGRGVTLIANLLPGVLWVFFLRPLSLNSSSGQLWKILKPYVCVKAEDLPNPQGETTDPLTEGVKFNLTKVGGTPTADYQDMCSQEFWAHHSFYQVVKVGNLLNARINRDKINDFERASKFLTMAGWAYSQAASNLDITTLALSLTPWDYQIDALRDLKPRSSGFDQTAASLSQEFITIAIKELNLSPDEIFPTPKLEGAEVDL